MKSNVRDILIAALHDVDGYLSGEDIATKLKISRTAVWKHIQQLKKHGYHIATVRRKGYLLLSPPKEFMVGEVNRILKTSYMGRKILLYPELGSTNSKAMELARNQQSKEGTCVVARIQRHGKGRRGRNWLSLSGGLWSSVILRPDFEVAKAPLVTFVAAVAITEAVREVVGLPAEIKWPNDIMCKGRKLGGILSEIESEAGRINYLVLGFGLNVNIRLSKFPQPLRGQATSVYRELKKEISLSDLFTRIMAKLETYYEYLKDDNVKELIKLWKKYDSTLGNQVSINMQNGEIISGTAKSINQSGALIVETEQGKRKTLTCGDLVIEHQIN